MFGVKLVLMYKWDTSKALELIERERIQSAGAVPALVRKLLESPELESRDVSSLTSVGSGGAPVPPDLVSRIGDQFDGRVSPGNGYGLTETTSAVVNNSGRDYFDHSDSVGLVVPTADIRIVAEDGTDAVPGQPGEIWFRGPNVVRGYWENPVATAEAFTDGWFHTGDVGYVDEDGFVYVVDRIKDVIIRGGENVYCAEVEAVLFEHPDIDDVAVVGLPDPTMGEKVCAVIVLREGVDALVDRQLQEFAATKLARFKVPEVVVCQTDPLPRNATGKVLKRDLRDRYAKVE
jgi:acyl-CoA synthetase (AMP-forming)/AMP-acid ligase II